MSLKAWNQVIGVDLTGPFLCTREFATKIIESKQKGGAVIVNISSVARHGNVGQSNYSAAKAGLVADTKVWGVELARYGIRVGAIAPGFVDTPILQGMRPEVLEGMLKGVPLRRTGKHVRDVPGREVHRRMRLLHRSLHRRRRRPHRLTPPGALDPRSPVLPRAIPRTRGSSEARALRARSGARPAAGAGAGMLGGAGVRDQGSGHAGASVTSGVQQSGNASQSERCGS